MIVMIILRSIFARTFVICYIWNNILIMLISKTELFWQYQIIK